MSNPLQSNAGSDGLPASTTPVSISAVSRPENAVRASLTNAHSFLTDQQVEARSQFLRRISGDNAAGAAAAATQAAQGRLADRALSTTDGAEDTTEEMGDVVDGPADLPMAEGRPPLAEGTQRPTAHPPGHNGTHGFDADAGGPPGGAPRFGHPNGPQRTRRAGARGRRRRAASMPTQRSRGFEEDDDDEDNDPLLGGVFAVPPASYYVAPRSMHRLIQAELTARQEVELREEERRQGERFGDGGVVLDEKDAGSPPPPDPVMVPQENAQVYRPMRGIDRSRQPPAQHGRILEEQRYNLPRCQPYRIPLYDQACLKHIFPNLFDPGFQFMEVFYWLMNAVLVVVQIVMVIVNVFFNDDGTYVLPWVRTASIVIFSVEFGVTMALVIFLIITIVHACVTKNIGTKLAQDIGALTTFISTFSILRAVGLASPTFAMRRIFPQFQNAIGPLDMLIGVGMGIVWLGLCVLAFLALIVKVTQIDFAYSTAIEDWTFPQFFQLIGLLMNLARVDDSYYKETAVLLDAIHRHFSTPGEAREANSMEKPCLLERLMRALGIPNYMYYEYFDSIFNYHMDWSRFEDRGAGKGGGGTAFGTAALVDKKKKTYNLAYQGEHDANEACTFDDIPMRMKWRNMFNYLSFVFEIDTVQLRRYLQMVQSPLPFYRVGRESFLLSFAEADALGMDMAVWHSDPILSSTRKYAKSDPDQFITRFVCEDRRDVWDPDYEAKAQEKERLRADAAFKEMGSRMAERRRRSDHRGGPGHGRRAGAPRRFNEEGGEDASRYSRLADRGDSTRKDL